MPNSPPRPPEAGVDPAEFLALQVLVRTIAALSAQLWEEAGRGPAQSYINLLSDLGRGALTGAKVSAAGLSSDALRDRALLSLNEMLSTITFAPGRG